MRRLLPLALLALSLLPARAQDGPRPPRRPETPTPEAEEDEEQPAQPAEEPQLEVLAPGDLEVRVERAGKIATAREVPVRVLPLEYAGQLLVTAVHPLLRTGGPVEQGTVLVQLDPRPLERELRAAREALASARLQRDVLEREQKVEEAAGRQELEQAELAARDAARALERFEKVEGPALQKDVQHDLQSAENSLADEREELSQLEGMYKGTQLATETKEIVLERARRALRLSEERLGVARTRATAVLEYDLPLQLRTHQDQARWAAADLGRAREAQELAGAKRRDALETATRAARDAEELMVRLEADRGAILSVTAPVSGLLAPLPDLRPGDVVEARAALTHVHEGSLVARIDAAEEDLRVLAPGAAGTVRLAAFGDVALPGTVAELAVFPAEEGKLAVTVQLGGAHPLVRFGLACRLTLPGPKLSGVLSIPRRAAAIEEGRATVQVWKDGQATPRDVVLGQGNRERVVVLSGLAVGEAVVLPAEGQ